MATRNIPLSLAPALAKRLPFYYGWVIMAVLGLVSFISGAFGPGVTGVMLRPMSEDLGWSRAVLPGATLLGSLLVVLVGPLSGRLTDLYGSRFIVSTGAIVMVACLFAIAATRSVVLFYVFFGAGYAIFTGVSRVSLAATTAQWFVRRRGAAAGVANIAIGLGYVIMPMSATLITQRWGWERAWFIMAFVTLFTAVPVSLLLLLQHPSDIGQRIDGDAASGPPPAPRGRRQRSAATEVQWTLSEAVRTPTMWLLLLGLSVQGIATNGLLIHIIPHLRDRGFSAENAALLFTLDGIVFAASGFILGPLADRLHMRWMYMMGSLSLIGLLLLAMVASEPWMVVPLALLMGMGFGSNVLVIRVAYADFFGRRSAGTIQGFVTPFQVIVSGSGALIAGLMYSIGKSYTLPFTVFIVLMLFAIVIMLFVPTPVKKATPTKETA